MRPARPRQYWRDMIAVLVIAFIWVAAVVMLTLTLLNVPSN